MEAAAVPYPKAVARFPKVRQSLLGSFDACALETHFEMSYRHGTTEHHQGRGQLFHRTAANCLREMARMGEDTIPVDAALAILDEVIAQDDADEKCPECASEKILPGLTRFMERTCGDCGFLFQTEFVNVPRKHIADLVWVTKKWAHDNAFDTSHIIDIEKRLNASVHYSMRGLAIERMLTGQLDVLMVDPDDASHAIVIDWKDTWKLPGKTTLSEEGFFQQRFYAWLVMSVYKAVERVTLREFYVRRSEVREATLWRHDHDQLTAEFSALVRKFDHAYEQQVFVPSPGVHCGWCARPQKCPIPTFTRGPGRITSEKVAKQVAAQLIVADRAAKAAKNALMAYVDQNGPIEVKDAKGKRIYGFVERPRTSRPSKEEIESALLRGGGELSSEDLDLLYREAKSTRFTDHAPPEREEDGADKTLLDGLEKSLARAAERKGI